MAAGAFPFLAGLPVARVGGFAGGATAEGTFCLLDRRPEDEVCTVGLGGSLESLLEAVFRFLVDGVKAGGLEASAEAAPLDAAATGAAEREERPAWLAA